MPAVLTRSMLNGILPRLASPPSRLMRRFSVREYHSMIDNGILTENDPVELLEGWIVSKMPHDPEHDSSIDKIAEALREILPKSWRIRVQSAITTGDSEPEPDITVARGPADRYDDRHPG